MTLNDLIYLSFLMSHLQLNAVTFTVKAIIITENGSKEIIREKK